MEEGLLQLQTTIHMQPTIQELPIGERGSFSRLYPSPGRRALLGVEPARFLVQLLKRVVFSRS